MHCSVCNYSKILHQIELPSNASLLEIQWSRLNYIGPSVEVGVRIYVYSHPGTHEPIHTLQPIDVTTTAINLTTPNVPQYIIDTYNQIRLHQSNSVSLLVLALYNSSEIQEQYGIGLNVVTATATSYKLHCYVDIIDHHACQQLHYQYTLVRPHIHYVHQQLQQSVLQGQLLARSCCGQDQTYIQRVAELFAQQLQCDEVAYTNNQPDHVSTAAIALGTIHSALNQQTHLVHMVAYILYPPLTPSERVGSLAKCAELIHWLRRWI